jgi:hypothetical protein
MASDSLLSPSSAPAASPAPTEHVDAAEEHTETAAATVVVDPPLMKLAVELRLQTLGYVLVNEEGAALIVKIGSHASGKPRMVHLKKNFDQVHLPPLADTLDMCAVSKALVGEVRDVFFGQNIFDLTGGMRWLRGIHPDFLPLVRNARLDIFLRSQSSSSVSEVVALVDFIRTHCRVKTMRVRFQTLVLNNQGEEFFQGEKFRRLPDVVALSQFRGVKALVVIEHLGTVVEAAWLKAIMGRV